MERKRWREEDKRREEGREEGERVGGQEGREEKDALVYFEGAFLC